MKTNSTISIITSAILLVCLAAPLYAGTPWLHTEGNKIKDPAGNVVILRGIDMIDLGFLDNWHGGAFAMIDRLTDKTDTQGSSPGWYPKIIRINITPPDSVGWGWPEPFYPGNCSFYNDLLRPIVDYCKLKDVYVIIDWHYVANTYDHVASTNQFWEYIAPKFANDSHVLFELFNEPINDLYGDWIFNDNDTADWLSVRQDMQNWANIVRTSAPKNLILVAGPFYAQVLKPTVDYPIDGTNIVYVSHIYPGHFLNWCWSNGCGSSAESYMDEIMACAAAHPVMMTEWGFSQSNSPNPGDSLNGTITNYGQPLMDFIEGLGISNSAWVASYNWGPPMFFNPDPNNWSNPTGPWPLRVGEGEMGGFVKDTLYAKRNANQPCDSQIQVSPTSVDFGEIEIGKSKALTVTISNISTSSLTITGAGIKTDFAFTSLPLLSKIILPGKTLTMETAYSPTVYGNNSAVLQINSSDASNPTIEIPLKAKGLLSPLSQSQIEVSPDIVDFGVIEFGKSKALTVSILNTGVSPLIITGAGIKTDFAFTPLPLSSTILQSCETMDLDTTYSPTAYGDNSAVLQINSSDVANPTIEIPLTAIGISSTLSPGEIVVSPTSFNFGEIALGGSAKFTVHISNTGSGALVITGAGIKTDFAFTTLPPLSTIIQPGKTSDMEMTYSPTAYGNNSAMLQINSTDANNPVVQITLSAKGIPSALKPGKIAVSPTSFNFGEITVGNSMGLTVHISNTGTGPLLITGAGIKTDFAVTMLPPLSTTIQPGETINMETTYSPTGYGNNSAVLQINSSDTSNPVVQVPLNAKGVLKYLTPTSQITNILALFDKYVKEGSLQWAGKNPSRPDYHLNILRNMVTSAQSSINRGKYTTACKQLTKIQKYFISTSPSHVEGTGADNLAEAIPNLKQTLGCK